MVLRGAAWCCMVLHDATWCCVVLRGAAWCCVIGVGMGTKVSERLLIIGRGEWVIRKERRKRAYCVVLYSLGGTYVNSPSP